MNKRQYRSKIIKIKFLQDCNVSLSSADKVHGSGRTNNENEIVIKRNAIFDTFQHPEEKAFSKYERFFVDDIIYRINRQQRDLFYKLIYLSRAEILAETEY